MIKPSLNKLFSVFIALLVVCSTVSFTLEKHYCCDVLIDVSIFYKAEKCGMEAIEKLQKRSCCKDEIAFVKGQDELKFSSFEDLIFEQQQFILSLAATYLNGFESLPKQFIPHKDYSPPNLVADLQVLDQEFLI